MLEDPLDVVDEAHAQHLVGLVEHQRLQTRDIQGAAAHVIHDPARRSHHDLNAAAQLIELHPHALPAVDRQHVKAGQKPRVGLHRLGDLQGQFAGRGKHQQLRIIGGRVDARQQRQRKGGRLAGTCLRLSQQIAARQEQWDGLGLDR